MEETLRNAVLATLAYYDIFDYPLTAIQTWQFLVNPSRLGEQGGVQAIMPGAVASELDRLAKIGRIGCELGMYAISPERTYICRHKIARQKIADRKWKKLLQLAFWFQIVPYARAFFISGSLALNVADKKSDFDVLVIARTGRLYTCRMFLSLAASMLGVRRRHSDAIAPDKFCFNHYISDKALEFGNRSLYVAQVFSQMVPIMQTDRQADDFYSANQWLNGYLYNFRAAKNAPARTIKESRQLKWLARKLEYLLNGKIGGKLEQLFRAYQQKRIAKNPLTYENGGRIVFNDKQLEFHPRSIEAAVIAGYNERLAQLGIPGRRIENDSGLA